MTNFGEVKNQFEEIMSAIRQMDQKTDYLDYVQRFPKDLDASADLRKEARFCDLILSRLEYTEMPNRYETIHDAHKQTFEWVFRDAAGATRPWDNFTRWLEDPEPEKGNIYWITGKPGSGKSTLMKFIYNDPRTVQHLTVWAGESTLATAGFFFWCSGTAMEMSRLGLLRSLLHQILHEHPNLITKVFHRRWQQYSFFRNGLQEWTWAELKNAFELLISESSLRLAFFIDGLDEFDGDHNELVKLILGAACLPHIKVCCASRPWLVFQDAFEHRPSLLLEHLTFEDIKRYISDEFSASKQYASLKEREPDAASLIDSVAERASGVFLWVMLVVNSLLQGIQNSDKVSDLRRRLESFPRDLESLYDRLLNSLDPFYFRQACQLIRIARAFDECSLADISLIQFSFADEENPAMAAIEAEIEPLPHAVWRAREEDMRRRLNSRCKGFLEADEYGRVRWLHRTAKDFIDTPHIWTKITQATEETFDPNLCLASAFLYELKCTGREHAELSMINRFLGLTALLERCTNEPQIPLVNEMHNFVRQPPAATSSGEPHDPRERPDKGFFADAVGAGNHLYILHLLENDPSRLGKPDLDEILEQIFTRQRYRDCSHLDLITKKAVERGAVPGPWIDHVSIPAEVRKAINPHLSLRARGKMSWQRIRRDISAALR